MNNCLLWRILLQIFIECSFFLMVAQTQVWKGNQSLANCNNFCWVLWLIFIGRAFRRCVIFCIRILFEQQLLMPGFMYIKGTPFYAQKLNNLLDPLTIRTTSLTVFLLAWPNVITPSPTLTQSSICLSLLTIPLYHKNVPTSRYFYDKGEASQARFTSWHFCNIICITKISWSVQGSIFLPLCFFDPKKENSISLI